ncbi:hypothetical protein GXP70_03135 [Paenibacillus lycopersici]|uniref:Lipoprotein n=1 Tax=Paenibacillus lycopersici TaxID=2704462 RepID=A0A6C0G2X6_9BACL|nr:hypothetical protein [Paenibacillus lycopersici]QHT59055.1 hypothetical protein GXP70_03135 [Paenibacillus lycopersici]
MNKIIVPLAAVLLAALLGGCEGQARKNAAPTSARQLAEPSAQQAAANAAEAAEMENAAANEQAVTGQSGSCEEPPQTLALAGISYAFAKLDPAEEPVMKLGYAACDQGRFMPGDDGPGTLVINGTAPSEGKRKAVIFNGPWGRALYETSGAANGAANGASADPHADSAAVANKDVRLVYMTFPIPVREVSSPLFGSRDQERIAALLHELGEAERVNGAGLASPLNGRSTALNIELNDGRLLQVRPAWTCRTGKDDDGDTTTSCTPVDDRIWISGPDGGAYFAKSEWLYRFVGKAYLDWMPNVQPYEAPDALPAGAPFAVRGHGSRTDRANVALMKGDKTVLNLQAAVNEGEWLVEGTTPDDLPAGDYEWKIDTGTTTYGVGVRVSK